MRVLCQKRDHQRGDLIRALRVPVVPGAADRRHRVGLRDVAGWQWLARPSLLTGAAMLACYVAMGLVGYATVREFVG